MSAEKKIKTENSGSAFEQVNNAETPEEVAEREMREHDTSVDVRTDQDAAKARANAVDNEGNVSSWDALFS